MSDTTNPIVASAPRIIGIAGSLRDKSYTRCAVRIALEGARAAGADAALIDLRSFKLPFCLGGASEHEPFPDVLRLRRDVQSAQGVVLGTPEYHGSFSGVLKNALDLTEPRDWERALIGLIGISGGSAGPGSALAALRSVGRGLNAWVLPQQVSIASAHAAFDKLGRPTSPELESRLLDFGRDLTRFARSHAHSEPARS